MWQKVFDPKLHPKLWQTFAVLILAPLVSTAITGCGRKGDPRVTPEAAARQALESALTAWQNGQAHGKIAGTSPPVEVADSVWKRGEKLKSYQIIGEVDSPDGLRWFSVRLQLASAEGSQEVQYLVMGKTALKIFRKEDYDLSRSWKGVGQKKDGKKRT